MSDIEFETNDAEIATDFLSDIELLNVEQLRAAVEDAGSPTPLLKKALQVGKCLFRVVKRGRSVDVWICIFS